MKHVLKRRSIFRNSSKKSTSSANFVYVAFRPMLMVGMFIEKSPLLHNYTLCGKGDFRSSTALGINRGATLILSHQRLSVPVTSITGEPVLHLCGSNLARTGDPAPTPRTPREPDQKIYLRPTVVYDCSHVK